MEKFERIIYHNRDKKYKISLINHIQYIFELNGIEEKIIRVIPTEYIDKDYSEKRMDFTVLCESGNIYNIECESHPVNEKTSDKTWNYVKELFQRYDNDIYSLIIALSENNKNPTKIIGTTKHEPIMFEMKKINGDKYLNSIKKKFENNEELTSQDCAIIETIPDMGNTKEPDIIVEELCNIIKEGVINTENRTKLQATMWLNIDYYIKDSEKRKELMEMIDVEKSQDSEFFKWQEEFGTYKENIGIEKGIEKGREEGREEIIKEFLKSMTPTEIAEKTNITLSEIKKIAQQ